MSLLQIVVVPHRVVLDDAEIDAQLAKLSTYLHNASGLIAHWQGKKFEERNTKVWVLLWESLSSKRDFFTSVNYKNFIDSSHQVLLGRQIQWNQNVLLGSSGYSDLARLEKTLAGPAIEVATTQVVDGRIAGYYGKTKDVTGPIMEAEEGCGGFFMAPSLEDVHRQLVLIHWKSVDAHHQDFEKKPEFQKCIEALSEFYAVFVVPWHIVDLKLVFGQMPKAS